MPGPGRALGPTVVAAVRDGEVAEADVDAAVFRLLSALDRIGVLDVPEPAQDLKVPRRGVTAPVAPGRGRINGPAQQRWHCSPSLSPLAPHCGDRPPRHRSIHHGWRVRSGDPVPDHHAARGASAPTAAPTWRSCSSGGCEVSSCTGVVGEAVLRAPDGFPGRAVCRDAEFEGASVETARAVQPPHGVVRQPGAGDGDRGLVHAGRRHRGPRGERHVPTRPGSGRLGPSLRRRPAASGRFHNPPPRGGSDFFGTVSQDLVAEVVFERGEPVELLVEFARTGDALSGFRVGFRTADQDALLERAVAAAAEADVAIVCIGTTGENGSEGHDRKDLELPGRQEELIRRVAAANGRTVVVVNAAAPIAMSWADDVRLRTAVLVRGTGDGRSVGRRPGRCVRAGRSLADHDSLSPRAQSLACQLSGRERGAALRRGRVHGLPGRTSTASGCPGSRSATA